MCLLVSLRQSVIVMLMGVRSYVGESGQDGVGTVCFVIVCWVALSLRFVMVFLAL